MASHACVFCQIIEGRLPSSKVYEDELCLGFLDIHPINPGHVLVVPKRHERRSSQLSEAEAGRLFSVAQVIYRGMQEAAGLRCEGANFFLSDGEIAGQEVGHAHLHIVPRFQGDGQRLGWVHHSSSREALDNVAAEILAKLT